MSWQHYTLKFQFSLELGGGFGWKHKDSSMRFRGDGEYSTLLVPNRFSTSVAQWTDFEIGLEALKISSWRPRYDPNDIGWDVVDGERWSFELRTDDLVIDTRGRSTWPDADDPSQTCFDPAAFSALHTLMMRSFGIPDAFARMRARREQTRSAKA